MKTQQLKKFNQIIAIFFCLAILTQNGVEAPVLCFETDGNVHIEASCDISCKIPVPNSDDHQDECDNCFDIHLWNYNPDLAFINYSLNAKNNHNDYSYIFKMHQPAQIKKTDFPIHENHYKHPLPPFLKHTILII